MPASDESESEPPYDALGAALDAAFGLGLAIVREFQVDEGACGGFRGALARRGDEGEIDAGLEGTPFDRAFSTTWTLRVVPASLELPSDSRTLASEPGGSFAYCC